MTVDAYRTKSARADYPAEPMVRQPDDVRAAAGSPGLGERAGWNTPAIDHFDSPHPAETEAEERYQPPRWLADERLRASIYLVIAVTMVLIFLLGFRPGPARPF